jgi:hypothetical protein
MATLDEAFIKKISHDVCFESELQVALQAALNLKSEQAASIFVSPTKHRAYSCDVENCSRPAYAKGHCNAHYIRLRSGRSLCEPVRARKREDKCVRCNCQTGSKGGWGLCAKHYKAERYAILKDAAINVFGGVCAKCKLSFPRCVFDFHHVGRKVDNPSSLLVNSSVFQIASELAKCIMLCANCHRMEHANEF